MLDGKVVIIGGGDPPTATVEMIDLNAASPAWQYMAPMSVRRRQHNTTLLPDGTVLVTGGSSGSGFDNSGTPVFHAEVWDPATNSWTRLASNTALPWLPLHRAAAAGRAGAERGRPQQAHRGGLLAALPLQGGAPDGQLRRRRW